MAQAFLHGGQDMGVASDLDEDDAIRVESGKMQGGREQVTIGEAPEDRAIESRQDSGEEHGRCGIVGELTATCDIVERARRNPARRNVPVDRLDAKRKYRVTRRSTFYRSDLRTQVSKGRGLTHGIR